MTDKLREIVGFDRMYDNYMDKAKAECTLAILDLPDGEYEKVVLEDVSDEVYDKSIEDWVGLNLPTYLEREACWEAMLNYINENHSKEVIDNFISSTIPVYNTLAGLERLVIEAFNLDSGSEERLH